MPEPKRPLKVFLCHAHADRNPVRGLYSRLTQDGVDAWFDKAKLLPGQDWELEIRKAVREADVVVVCLSKQFNQAGFRQKEVRLALDTAMEKPEGEIFIIPARLEECDNLESLRKWHWVDLFEEDGYEMLMRALRARADRIGATLQIKKSWLPKITSPRSTKQKPAEIKNLKESQKKNIETNNKFTDNYPAGWDTEWMPSSESEKAKSEGDENAEHEAAARLSKTHSSPKRTFNTTSFISVMAIVFCVASVTLIPILSSLSKKPEPTPTPQIKLTNTVEVISSPFSTLAVTEIPSLTSTPVITVIPARLPTEITDAKDVKMELVSVNDSTPFYMDKFEVTNKLYKTCVASGACSLPTNLVYYNQTSYSNHPVVYVTQDMAVLYCEWRDARLPTFYDFVAAIQGENKSLYYPWNEVEDSSCEYANYASGFINYQTDYKYCVGTTVPVGSYELGKSAFNIYDLIGNVAEWSGSYILGGSWASYKPNWFRQVLNTKEPISNNTIGFRCTRDVILE